MDERGWNTMQFLKYARELKQSIDGLESAVHDGKPTTEIRVGIRERSDMLRFYAEKLEPEATP